MSAELRNGSAASAMVAVGAAGAAGAAKARALQHERIPSPRTTRTSFRMTCFLLARSNASGRYGMWTIASSAQRADRGVPHLQRLCLDPDHARMEELESETGKAPDARDRCVSRRACE